MDLVTRTIEYRNPLSASPYIRKRPTKIEFGMHSLTIHSDWRLLHLRLTTNVFLSLLVAGTSPQTHVFSCVIPSNLLGNASHMTHRTKTRKASRIAMNSLNCFFGVVHTGAAVRETMRFGRLKAWLGRSIFFRKMFSNPPEVTRNLSVRANVARLDYHSRDLTPPTFAERKHHA